MTIVPIPAQGCGWCQQRVAAAKAQQVAHQAKRQQVKDEHRRLAAEAMGTRERQD